MEIFKAVSPANSDLFIEVGFNFTELARTWVMSELIATNAKTIILDSQPGSGLIPFAKVGATSFFQSTNRLVIVTYLDLQKKADPDAFLKTFEINYHLVEDDDVPGEFYKSKHYKGVKTEIVLSANKKIALLTKVIEIQ
ncbi:hypothetical protein [Flavobacterium wongokense]|uniref:hypothetical protein n=1 Tax=Flavobacterium wongokense TaxID=2910674 RepID=UPI001F38E96E|nr:hypothetical protein [Flavobacterium sp. WG47]MCF6130901.1 hypothetical protein [Flavobacterium sp. WG47]